MYKMNCGLKNVQNIFIFPGFQPTLGNDPTLCPKGDFGGTSEMFGW